MLSHDLAVDLRVTLAGVADQDEREIRVHGEQRAYDAEFVTVVVAQGRRAPVLQEKRARRHAVYVEEVFQHVVEVPGAAGDVEDRVEVSSAQAELQGPVEVRYALERQASMSVAQQYDADHPQQVRHARPEHRVVEVADDAELRAGRHEHAPQCPRPSFTRMGPEQLDLDRMPASTATQRLL